MDDHAGGNEVIICSQHPDHVYPHTLGLVGIVDDCPGPGVDVWEWIRQAQEGAQLQYREKIAAMARIAVYRKVARRLRKDLTTNAALLARQCDLAREAETRLAKATRERDDWKATVIPVRRVNAELICERDDALAKIAALTNEICTSRDHLPIDTPEEESLSVGIIRMRDQIKELEKERNALLQNVKDDEEWYRAVMQEDCPDDEHHCACVPLLRGRIKRLEQERVVTPPRVGGTL